MHDLANLHWNHVETPLLLVSWLLFITFAKIFFYNATFIRKIFPESAVLIVLGLVAGYLIYDIWQIDLYLHPDLFFLYLLPSIILDAGYFMPSKSFITNIGTILTYAVIGTLLNVFMIASTLYYFSNYFLFELSYLNSLLFASLISAVDPVAVISVFEEVHVNKILYICVFGESLLNDAVTVVLYQSFHGMVRISEEHLINDDYTIAAFEFLLISCGGILIGVLFAAITTFVTRYASNVPYLQPLICLTLPYIGYLLAEFGHLSGILGLVTCGLLMKPYVAGSMCEKADITLRYFLKTLSSNCEAIIFVFLGFSIFSKNHKWDLIFTFLTVFTCLISRFLVVFILTYFANRCRIIKIPFRDQIIMGFGGLRGAICFGLVVTLDYDSIEIKPILVSTTLVVIATTVFIQGTLIKPLVKYLHIEREDHGAKLIFERVVDDSIDDLMLGIETIIGSKGRFYWKDRFQHISEDYLEPSLTRRPNNRAHRLMEKFTIVSTEEQKQALLQELNV